MHILYAHMHIYIYLRQRQTLRDPAVLKDKVNQVRLNNICLYTYKCMSTHTYILICTFTDMHTYVYYIHTCVYPYMQVCLPAHMHLLYTHMHIYIYIHFLTCTHAHIIYTCTYIHIHIHIYSHAHMHTLYAHAYI